MMTLSDAADYCPDVEDDDYGGDPDQAEDNIDNSFDGDIMTARKGSISLFCS